MILKVIFAKCGPRSDCYSRIRVHTVCLYANIGLKSLQEYSADNINRISDAGFLGILRVKVMSNHTFPGQALAFYHTFFHKKLTTALLESAIGRWWPQKIFQDQSPQKNARIEPVASWSPVWPASDLATEAGYYILGQTDSIRTGSTLFALIHTSTACKMSCSNFKTRMVEVTAFQ